MRALSFSLIGGATCAALSIAPVAAPAQSSNAQEQFWPELDYYQHLSDRSRIFAQAIYHLAANNGLDNEQYGINLDLFAKPHLLDKRIWGARSVVEDRNIPLMLRLGYRYQENFNTSSLSIQNRLLVEGTIRREIWDLLAEDRNGFDWRWTNGVYSTRYRNRLQLQHSFDLQASDITPYANAEWTYTITDGRWTGVEAQVGAQFPVRKRLSAQLYLAQQNTWASSPTEIRALGLTVILSL